MTNPSRKFTSVHGEDHSPGMPDSLYWSRDIHMVGTVLPDAAPWNTGSLFGVYQGGSISDVQSLWINPSPDGTTPGSQWIRYAFSPQYETLDAVSIGIASHGQALFSWSSAAGGTLVDLTTATNPQILDDGIYGISLGVGVPTAPAGTAFSRVSIGYGDAFAAQVMTIEGGTSSGPAYTQLGYIGPFAAGQGLEVQVTNDTGGSLTFEVVQFQVVRFS